MSVLNLVAHHEPEALFSQGLNQAFETYEHDSNKSIFRSLLTSFDEKSDEHQFLKSLKALYFAYIFQRDYGDLDLHLLLLESELKPSDINFSNPIFSQNQLITV